MHEKLVEIFWRTSKSILTFRMHYQKQVRNILNSQRNVYKKSDVGSRLSSSQSWDNPQVSCVSG